MCKSVYFLTMLFCLVPCSTLLFPPKGYCLEPDEILVVTNSRMAHSVKIGRYYMKRRNIPEKNLLKISTTTREIVDRDDYVDEIKKKIKKKIVKLQTQAESKLRSPIAAIVLCYGIPLKIVPPQQSYEILDEVKELRHQVRELRREKKEGGKNSKREIKRIKRQIKRLLDTDSRASVDSELSLVMQENYELSGWIQNPYYLGNRNKVVEFTTDQVLLVARLDGPDPATVYRIIDDTLAAEKTGLRGRGYFDARGLAKKVENVRKAGSGYKRYDYSIKLAAKSAESRMDVTLDDTKSLFKENCCPEAALYCGWYSLAKYRDSFDWVQGAIGYHIASSECASLRNTKKSFWCLKMLEKGVAATIGPVYEPYVQGFPLPEIFFSLLTEGHMSLGESYLVSLPVISWQMVLVGDPLYQPFKPLELD